MPLKRFRFRFTIERIRTLVLVGGIVLVGAIVAFLALGKWRRHFLAVDLPKRLGANIQLQANDFDYEQTSKGKKIFKIHANRAIQLKGSGKAILHDVRIELYGEDGNRTDTISGAEFEYDKEAGLAQAKGPVEITLMRPGVRPAVADLKPELKAELKQGAKVAGIGPDIKKMPEIVGQITDGQIHVRTSGLLFNQKTGQATTSERVDFALQQGSGSSTGASYDSGKGKLVLDRAVELHVNRIGGPVTVHAVHAEFERTDQVCELTQAQADYSGGNAQFATVLLHFRDDGSVARLDGSGGVDLRTASGSQLTAPRGTLDFDEESHPHHGLLEGGAKLDSSQPGRQMQGSAPTAQLDFDGDGQLRKAHLVQGVLFDSRQQVTTAKGSAQVHRNWKSASADITFVAANAASGNKQAPDHSSQGHIAPSLIQGFGGVVVTAETTGAGPNTGPQRLAADTLVATFAPGSQLTRLDGAGHTSFDQRTAEGAHQASSSDQLTVHFLQRASAASSRVPGAASEIESVVQTGNVSLVQTPAPAGKGTESSEMRATAARLDYDGASQQMHLSGLPGAPPRVRNGALELSAIRIDFARASGDAFAHGDVKASWSNVPAATLPAATLFASASGTGGPVHAVAAEAELHQGSQEVTFRGAAGATARLWREGNSVAAPVIVLNRQKQTLAAESAGAANPVRTVLVSNPPAPDAARQGHTGKPSGPTVLRVSSGQLRYSEGERLAVFQAGGAGGVKVETNENGIPATVVSDHAEVTLLPAGAHAAAGGTAVDRMVSQGHVAVTWPGRRGTGEKLVYLGDQGTFTLTGTSAAPPRITDQARGSVTGSALIFRSHDDSVTVEGDGGKTATETRSPR